MAYFSLGNLKGGAISIGIGIVFYVAVVRGLLMKRSDGGGGLRRPPAVLAGSENLLYRPLLLRSFAWNLRYGMRLGRPVSRLHGGDCISGGVLRGLPGHGFIR